MGAEHYLFALFVFALAAMLVVLILRGRNKNRDKEEAEREEREKKMMMMYFEVEDMIDALKEYVEASQGRIEADIRRIETDMAALSALRESLQMMESKIGAQAEAMKAAIVAPPVPPEPIEVQEEETEEDLPLLQVTARNMQDEGKDIDQIAQQMNLSKTEVAFMLKLEKYGRRNQKKINDIQEKKLKF
ncbi:hypothetical protein LJC56_08375 [Christensenellaceae bacterium OttesenSCG-928-K19]|nr:hypothetical protein [Christensenellaceae bacterium OttesenSCG-928-K19]